MRKITLGKFVAQFTKRHGLPRGCNILLKPKRGQGTRPKRIDASFEAIDSKRCRDVEDAETVREFLELMSSHAPQLGIWSEQYKLILVAPDNTPVPPGWSIEKVRGLPPAITNRDKEMAQTLREKLTGILVDTRKQLPPRLIVQAAIRALVDAGYRKPTIKKAL